MAISTVSPPGHGPTSSISWRADVKRHLAQDNERDRMPVSLTALVALAPSTMSSPTNGLTFCPTVCFPGGLGNIGGLAGPLCGAGGLALRPLPRKARPGARPTPQLPQISHAHPVTQTGTAR